MSAYLMFTRTKGEAELDIYCDKIRATFAGHQVKLLASDCTPLCIERCLGGHHRAI